VEILIVNTESNKPGNTGYKSLGSLLFMKDKLFAAVVHKL